MGWAFGWDSRKQLVDHLTRSETHTQMVGAEETTVDRKCLNHCLRGNVLWSVWELTYSNTPIPRRYIGCDLLQNHSKALWGYKDMDESCQPFYYTCPMKYLNRVPEVASQAWRDLVIERARVQSLKVNVGDLVGLDKRFTVRVVQIVKKIGRSTLVGLDQDGTRFNIKRSYLSGDVFNVWPAST